MKRKIVLSVLILAMALIFAACGGNDNYNDYENVNGDLGEFGLHRVREETWDGFETRSVITIFYYDYQSDSREQRYRDIIEEGFEKIRELDGIFNRFIEGTDVWRLNNAGGEFVEVSPHLINVLRYSQELREMSGGGFDITIGAVSQFWGFSGVNLPRGSMPTQEQLDWALPLVGTEIIIEGNMARLAHPEAKVDLGGVAKGYATDVVAALLKEHGVLGIVDMGGDNMLVGQRPDGNAWRVGITLPFTRHLPDDYTIGAVNVVGTYAVLSSAIDIRYFMIDDDFHHHILDVNTGMPVGDEMLSVTVAAPNGVMGEGMTTAIFALGPIEGMALVNRTPGVEAVIILRDLTPEGRPIMVSEGLGEGGDIWYEDWLAGIDFGGIDE